MANVVLYWSEIEAHDWPDCCVQCGADGTRLRERKLWVMRYRVFYHVREYLYVDLPFCRLHEKAPFWDYYRLGVPHAKNFTNEGVLMKNVSPVFIEELERHRDRLDRRDEEQVRRRLAIARDDPDDRDDDRADDRPRRRRREGAAPPPRSSSWLMPTLIILGAFLAVPVGACCLCVGGSALSRNNVRPAVQFGPNPPAVRPDPFPARPPFGPNPRFK